MITRSAGDAKSMSIDHEAPQQPVPTPQPDEAQRSFGEGYLEGLASGATLMSLGYASGKIVGKVTDIRQSHQYQGKHQASGEQSSGDSQDGGGAPDVR